MRVENRNWGRPNPVDYVPVAGLVYRFYWLLVARRGMKSGETQLWSDAVRSELGRLFVAGGFTAALAVFVAFGGIRGTVERALIPALVVGLASVFLHRLLSLARVF
jgi:hypothetical protein